MQGNYRKNIRTGLLVRIVQKEDQRSGDLTEGYVRDILTNAPQHPHGIKVRLDTGEVGRVKEIIEEDEIEWPEWPFPKAILPHKKLISRQENQLLFFLPYPDIWSW